MTSQRQPSPEPCPCEECANPLVLVVASLFMSAWCACLVLIRHLLRIVVYIFRCHPNALGSPLNKLHVHSCMFEYGKLRHCSCVNVSKSHSLEHQQLSRVGNIPLFFNQNHHDCLDSNRQLAICFNQGWTQCLIATATANSNPASSEII